MEIRAGYPFFARILLTFHVSILKLLIFFSFSILFIVFLSIRVFMPILLFILVVRSLPLGAQFSLSLRNFITGSIADLLSFFFVTYPFLPLIFLFLFIACFVFDGLSRIPGVYVFVFVSVLALGQFVFSSTQFLILFTYIQLHMSYFHLFFVVPFLVCSFSNYLLDFSFFLYSFMFLNLLLQNSYFVCHACMMHSFLVINSSNFSLLGNDKLLGSSFI